jgi:hypothetical protein
VANYSMTPYAFSLNPRNARGGERKPIANINGDGQDLRSLIEDKLSDYTGDDLIIDSEDDSKSLRVARMYQYSEFTFVEFGIGRAGYVGTLHQRNGGRVGYAADEHNESLIRGMFVFPDDAHEAYWLSERAGNSTALSYLENVFLRAIREAAPELTAKIEPVADWAAVRAWSSNVLVQELRFDAPRAGGSTQAIEVNGLHAEVRVTVKPRGLALNKIVKASGPDREEVFGFLSMAPLIARDGISAESVIGDGWRAHVAFKNPAGRQRSFGLATEDVGPSLVYEVGSSSAGRSRAYRPEDREFAATCSEFLTDVAGRLPVGATVASDILNKVL